MSRATVLGASGFVGSHLAAALRDAGIEVFAPPRGADLAGQNLGTVYYCIGLTAGFRTRPLETVEAHVGVLREVLRTAKFDKLVYLSSTRVYDATGNGSTNEDATLPVRPADPSDLYNLSKLMGESLTLHGGKLGIVARLSNVVGPDFKSELFLPTLIREALAGKIVLRSDPESTKDYIGVADAVKQLIALGHGRERIYNVASGRNTTHATILNRLRELTGCTVEVAGGPRQSFPPIDAGRMRGEFGLSAEPLEPQLPAIVTSYRERLGCPT